MKLGLICFSMPNAISLWRPMQMRGIGCDMAMPDVEEGRDLKITPGSVEVGEWEIDGFLTMRKMSLFLGQVYGSFLQLRTPLEIKTSYIVRKMCSAAT